MVVVSKRRRSEERQEHDNEQNPMLETPIAQQFADDPQDEEQKREDDRLAAMQKQIEDLKGLLAERDEDRLSYLSQPLMPSQVTQQRREAPKEEQLPDPLQEPELYAQVLSRNLRAKWEWEQEQRVADNKESQDNSARAEQMMEDFTEAYPDLSDDPELIEFAASKAVKRAQKKGLDPQRYMFVTQKKFFKDVANELRKFVPAERDDDDEDHFSERAPRRMARGERSRRDQDQDDGRSAGIFGGQESGGRPAPRSPQAEGKDLISELQDMQKKSGFF